LKPSPRAKLTDLAEQIRAGFALFKVRQKDAVWPARKQTLQIGLSHGKGKVAQIFAAERQDIEGDQLGLVILLSRVQSGEV
jgi:hypothetical protein